MAQRMTEVVQLLSREVAPLFAYFIFARILFSGLAVLLASLAALLASLAIALMPAA